MAEVFSAEVTASIAKYAAEIAKIETETGKSATKAAATLVAKMTAAQTQAGQAAATATARATAAAEALATKAAAAQSRAADAAVTAANRSATAWQSANLANAAFSADAVDAAARAKLVNANLTAGASAASRAMGNNAAAVGMVGHQLSDVASQLSTGTNPLTIMVQQGPQIVSALAMVEGGLGAIAAAAAPLVTILGPVAVAAAALGAVYLVLADNLETAEEAMRSNAEAATLMQSAYLKQADTVTDLDRRVRVVTGEITKSEAAFEREAETLRASREEMRQQLVAREAATAAALRSEDATYADRQAHAAAVQTLAAYDAKTERLVGTLGMVIEEEEKSEKATRSKAEATKEAADQMSFFAMALIQYEEAQRVQAEAEARRAFATGAAIDFVGESWDRTRARAAKAGEAMRKETADAQAAIEARGADEQAAIISTLEAQQNAVASLLGTTADAFALASENIEGLSKKQAETLFRVTQAAQLAQAVVLGAGAIIQGLAQAGPLGGIAAGAAVAVQVATIAAAKPPSFRQGTPGYASPVGEQPITANVGPGEGIAVVSRQGMASARSEGVAATNAGLGSGGGTTVNYMVLDGEVIASWITSGAKTRAGKKAIKGAMSSSFRNPYRST